MKWIKATERLPELPNPLPPDTQDERGVLFVNRTHSSAYFWFPSFGQPSVPYTTENGHWALEQYEWLDESELEATNQTDIVGVLGLVEQAREVIFTATAAEDSARELYLLNEIGDRLVECLELIGDLNTNKVKWQTRSEMKAPTNPLQELREILTRTSRDTSEDRMIACLYGIIVGWDNDSYKELKEQHGWTDENIEFQKMWHRGYNRAWNLFVNDLPSK